LNRGFTLIASRNEVLASAIQLKAIQGRIALESTACEANCLRVADR